MGNKSMKPPPDVTTPRDTFLYAYATACCPHGVTAARRICQACRGNEDVTHTVCLLDDDYRLYFSYAELRRVVQRCEVLAIYSSYAESLFSMREAMSLWDEGDPFVRLWIDEDWKERVKGYLLSRPTPKNEWMPDGLRPIDFSE